jgi:sugar phosphate isomerase/epimerase
MAQDRRSFLFTLGAATLGIAGGGRLAHGILPARKKLNAIGIQLYTVRRDFMQDPAATLARVAQTKYTEVEFAGYANRTPAEIRSLLSQNGLRAPSTHLAMDVIDREPQKTFADAKTIGHEWVTVPSPPRGKHETVDDWKRTADRFNRAAAAAKSAGLRFAYHNHNAELNRIGDAVPLEVLLKETDPSLVAFEMDIYWVVNGGGDPVDLLTRYPTRFKMLHVKDTAGAPDQRMVDVGAGTIDFKAVFAKASAVEHYFVEHDNPVDPFASARTSYEYLAKLEY